MDYLHPGQKLVIFTKTNIRNLKIINTMEMKAMPPKSLH